MRILETGELIMNNVKRITPDACLENEPRRAIPVSAADCVLMPSPAGRRQSNGIASTARKDNVIQLDEAELDSSGLPMIQLPGEAGPSLLSFAIQAGDLMRGNGLFRRGMVPVTVHRETGVVAEMTARRFKTFIQHFASTYKLRRNDDGDIERSLATMTTECAEATLESDAFLWQLYPIERINPVPLPVFRESGELELLPVGYDEESGAFTCDCGFEYDKLDLPEARMVMQNLFRDFPFSDSRPDNSGCDRAVAIAGMLSVFGDMLLPHDTRRLNFIYNANCPGSGKTLLAQIALIPVMGECRMQTLLANDDEFRQVLDTETRAEASYLFFDNVKGYQQIPTLEALLSTTTWEGRGACGSRSGTAQKTGTVFVTGTNLETSAEIRRYALCSELYIEEADTRTLPRHTRPLDATALRQPDVRRTILSALWALVREWDKTGRPACSLEARGFETWSHIYGAIVEHAGLGCPLERTVENNDRDFADMHAVVTGLVEKAERIYSNARWTEVQLSDIVVIARQVFAFESHLEGCDTDNILGVTTFSLTHESQTKFSLLLGRKFGGCVFTLAD
ncbi:hypothetical protein DB346_01330 [Verrucomicrobia bacterium LW23]|nr:hypothetical protein DB346_01330 [Verrucomicrobia bacterium LW23]